ARTVPEPGWPAALRHEWRMERHGGAAPRPGLRHRARSPGPADRRNLAGAGRGQPGHGERDRRREGAVGIGALRRRSLRFRHGDGPGDSPHKGGARAARAVRVAAAGTILAGAYGEHEIKNRDVTQRRYTETLHRDVTQRRYTETIQRNVTQQRRGGG